MLRETPTRDEQFAQTFRWLVQTVKKLQRGPSGEVYLGPRVHIGELVVEARDAGGGHIELVAWNQATPEVVTTIVTV